MFLIHRVELKDKIVELSTPHGELEFLIHRVELKDKKTQKRI